MERPTTLMAVVPAQSREGEQRKKEGKLRQRVSQWGGEERRKREKTTWGGAAYGDSPQVPQSLAAPVPSSIVQYSRASTVFTSWEDYVFYASVCLLFHHQPSFTSCPA